MLRFGLPVLVIGMVVALLLSTAWTALMPAGRGRRESRSDRWRSRLEMAETMAEGAVIRPGWVEPDPYPIYIAALTEGVVEEMLKVEDRVAPGEVVADWWTTRPGSGSRKPRPSPSLNRQRAISKISRRPTWSLKPRIEEEFEVAEAEADKLQRPPPGSMRTGRRSRTPRQSRTSSTGSRTSWNREPLPRGS